MKLKNISFRLESELVKTWYRLTAKRPTSFPYLSGDGFRSLADWRFEQETQEHFNAETILPGSLGYCDGWLLKDFIRGLGQRIRVPFRLISHNADPNITDELVKLWPEKLTHLFTTNCLVVDRRIHPIPIGIENARLHYNGIVRDFERLRKWPKERMPRILVAFTPGTNLQKRGPALESLRPLDTVDLLERTNSREYRRIARGYQFIASPPGNGEDCHRTWEALYLGAIPIVLRSSMTEAFISIGLPLWIVDSYDEVGYYDEKALAEKYASFSSRLDLPALWMDYWVRFIKELT